MKLSKFSAFLIVVAICLQLIFCNVVFAAEENYTTVKLSRAIDFNGFVNSYQGDLHIIGTTDDAALNLSGTVTLTKNLKLEKVILNNSSTIYANGYSLEICDSTTSTSRLTVYGGGNGTTVANTNIRLLGGQYATVYGGSNGGSVTGNTNVYFGGNANIGDVTDDETSGYYGSSLYGGGNNSAVLGTSNVTLDGNAAAAYVFGAGNGTNGTASATNVLIKGGQFANVYGGAASAALSECSINVTMTGGLVESIFGGNGSGTISGNANVTLLGGNVSRRVFTGCYNDLTLKYNIIPSWTTTDYINGTTCLTIGPDVLLNTKTGLSSGNSKNVGVFAGSRLGNGGNSNEKNTIIYLDGCYGNQSSKIGDKSGYSLFIYSNAKYVVNASAGGKVYSTTTAGNITVEPENGKYAEIGSSKYGTQTVSISTGTTTVNFKEQFNISSLTAQKTDTGVSVSAKFSAVNLSGETNPCLYTAVYDANNLVCVEKTSISDSMTSNTSNFEFDYDDAKIYSVKAMILADEIKPLCNAVSAAVN